MEPAFLMDRPAGTRAAKLRNGGCESVSLPGFWLQVDWLWQEALPDTATCLAKILGR